MSKFKPPTVETEVKWNSAEDFATLGAAAQVAVRSGLERSAEYLVAYVKNKIGVEGGGIPSEPGDPPHKQTGNLQDSIGIHYGEDIDDNVVIYIDEEMAPYWFYLEYGRKKMEPRPFWRTSLEETKVIIGQIAAAQANKTMKSSQPKDVAPKKSSILAKVGSAIKNKIGGIFSKIKSFRKR